MANKTRCGKNEAGTMNKALKPLRGNIKRKLKAPIYLEFTAPDLFSPWVSRTATASFKSPIITNNIVDNILYFISVPVYVSFANVYLEIEHFLIEIPARTYFKPILDSIDNIRIDERLP